MASKDIDENLQSRQLAVYGREAMTKMTTAHVFISGFNGLGCEVAKNVILSNVGAVTLHDEHDATVEDLGSNFYLRPEHVGVNRAKASLQSLKELNPSVTTDFTTATLLSLFVKATPFNVVVLIDTPIDAAIKINEYTYLDRFTSLIQDGKFGAEVIKDATVQTTHTSVDELDGWLV